MLSQSEASKSTTSTTRPAGLRLNAISPIWALTALIGLYSAALIAGGAFKFALWGQGFDMVDFSLPVWSTTQGRFLGISRFNFTDTFLGLDVALGFLPAIPFYALIPSFYVLIVVQTLLLASGAIPVYLIARDRFASPWAGVAWAATYLLYPTTQFVTMTAPFQPRIPGLLCILWGFWFFQRRSYWPWLALTLIGMLSRTDAALIAIAFGMYAALERRGWRWAVPPILFGALYFYAAITYISPAFYSESFQPQRVEVEFDLSRDYNDIWPCGMSPQACYYLHLGGSLGEIAKNILTHPLEVAGLLFEPAKVEYLLLLSGTLLFLPLLAPKELLLAAPPLAVNLLSTRPYQYVITEQYQILVIPGLIIAGICGGARLWQWLKNRWTAAAQCPTVIGSRLLLAQIAIVALLNIPLKNPVVSTFRNHEDPARVALMEEMRAMIPPDAAVSATSFLGPHLMPRQKLYYIPPGPMHHQIDEADYAFIDERAAVLQGTDLVANLRADPAWEVVAEIDDLVLLKHNR